MKDGNVILFDCFGLFAEDPFVTFFARHYGEEGAKLKDHFCEGADLGKVDRDQLLLQMEAELGIDGQEILKELKEIAIPKKEMLDLAMKCRERHRVYLLSNCIKGMLEMIFDGTSFADCFDGQFRSYEMKLTKPGREIYEATLRNIAPINDRIIFFDDNPNNLVEARNLGIDSVLFTDVHSCEQALIIRGLL